MSRNKKNAGVSVILLASSVLLLPVSNASDWELEIDKNYIQIYTRDASGSDFKEFKGVTGLKTSLNSLVALLEDTGACRAWVYKCITERTLKAVNSSDRYVYSVSDGSPFDNRDSIVHMVRTQDAETKTVIFKRTGVPDFIPGKPNMVRVSKIDGTWTLKPEHNGNVVITFQTASDPGGNIPAFLANTAVTDTPFNTLLKLRTEVMKTKYQSVKNLVDELEQ